MRDEIADLVFPVLRYGVQLRKRLLSRHATKLDWQKEQKEILGLLQAAPKARDAVGDYLGDNPYGDVQRSSSGSSRFDNYLGIRYALACWIDEIMIQKDLPWDDVWNENAIEWALYSSNDRATRFWDQARRAQVRPSRDPLEVFYLCVMLGFRGEKVEHPHEIRAWRDQVEAQLTEERPWALPPEKKVKPNVPPLIGPRRKQRMLLLATVSVLIFIPLVAYAVVTYFSH